ncbi:hypothetical protein [Nitrosomonas communis]|uniref:hypothetical protein n=1 Tax=Nitrosomonas communis TaxID=44574 RepID=UPI0026F18ED2|nr:hypothetical protein [Nitrosomonas communis]MCO6428725.1 hypothetical protein [Nitrosomonas communis]
MSAPVRLSPILRLALRDTNKPIGVAEYQLVHSLPKKLQTSLPSIEQIERELGVTGEAESCLLSLTNQRDRRDVFPTPVGMNLARNHSMRWPGR